jgi:hypothetical protein
MGLSSIEAKITGEILDLLKREDITLGEAETICNWLIADIKRKKDTALNQIKYKAVSDEGNSQKTERGEKDE